jgi:hypothetical protein
MNDERKKRLTPDEVKEFLNNLGWEEQMEFEMSERYPDTSEDARREIAFKIQEL